MIQHLMRLSSTHAADQVPEFISYTKLPFLPKFGAREISRTKSFIFGVYGYVLLCVCVCRISKVRNLLPRNFFVFL